MNILEMALELHAQGISTIWLPAGSKKPAPGQGWIGYSYRRPRLEELQQWFADPDGNIAVVGGGVSGNLLMLDADTPEALQEALGAFQGLGVRDKVWIRQRPPNGTAHDGGGLIVLRSSDAVRSCNVGALDFRSEGRYGLVPPSMHPAGGQYYWSQRPGHLPIIDFRDLNRVWPDLRLAAPPKRITSFAWSVLKGDPKVLGRYPSRSEAEYALCLSLVQTGHAFGDVLRLFRSNPVAGKFAEMDEADPHNAERWLTLTYQKAVAWAAQHPAESGAARLAADLEIWALAQPWSGRTGPYDLAVYLAHLAIVQRCLQDPYGASCRELAELAGVNFMTANRATNRLLGPKYRLLERTSPGTSTLSAGYTLVVPGSFDPKGAEVIHFTHTHPCEKSVSTLRALMGHDSFRSQGLGKSAAQVAALLRMRGQMTEKELETTGRCRSTVRRALIRLTKCGLADPRGDGVWRWVPKEDLQGALDRAAEELETSGALTAQQERHRRARLCRDHWMARQAEHGRGE